MPNLLVINHDETGQGVAATKNAGLAALMDAGCQHLFLVDDDVWPKVPEWWQPYVSSDIPHLMYLRPSGNKPYDEEHAYRKTPSGVVLYYKRHVIERVGGMRTEFGRYGSEHGEHSRRIYNTGLTPHPFMGLRPKHSRRIWHALDFEEGVESSVDKAAYDADWPRRDKIRRKYWDSTEYVEFRR